MAIIDSAFDSCCVCGEDLDIVVVVDGKSSGAHQCRGSRTTHAAALASAPVLAAPTPMQLRERRAAPVTIAQHLRAWLCSRQSHAFSQIGSEDLWSVEHGKVRVVRQACECGAQREAVRARRWGLWRCISLQRMPDGTWEMPAPKHKASPISIGQSLRAAASPWHERLRITVFDRTGTPFELTVELEAWGHQLTQTERLQRAVREVTSEGFQVLASRMDVQVLIHDRRSVIEQVKQMVDTQLGASHVHVSWVQLNEVTELRQSA
jgi:hypothetical protein